MLAPGAFRAPPRAGGASVGHDRLRARERGRPGSEDG